MSKEIQKIIVFFWGILTIILLLEVGLRISGSIYQWRISLKKTPLVTMDKDCYTILCLGNSFTYGTGAPAGESYPDHLQNLFNARVKRKKFVVINKGELWLNSAELLNRLEANINETNPDLIILRTGSPNRTNHTGYSAYLERNGKFNAFTKKIFFSLKDYLYRLRVYRLTLLLSDNIKNKINSQFRLRSQRQKNCYQEQEGYKEAEEYVKTIRRAIRYKGNFLIEKQKNDEAIGWFKKGVDVDPARVENYSALGLLYRYQYNYNQAMKWYIKGIKARPCFRINDEINYNYLGLIALRSYIDDKAIKEPIDNFSREFKETNPNNSDGLLYLTDKEIENWIRSDIKEIMRIIQKKKVKLIMQNYPPLTRKRANYINVILRKMANNLNIPFVDNERLFQKMLDKGEKKGDYFEEINGIVGDHPNSKGYKVMAENIYNKIMKGKNLNSD